LGIDVPGPPPRLVVLRDRRRGETWAFGADEVAGIRRVPRGQWQPVPSTLANPAVGFSQAVLCWDGRSVGLLDEQRVFAALREIGS
jgi:chemotaxis-related protein WspD